MKTPFHLAFPVLDIEETKSFYQDVLGCKIGREDKKWVDFNFFGHQLSAHLKPDELNKTKKNEVDGKSVPVRHFGVILEWNDWQVLSKKLKKINTDFIIEPYFGKLTKLDNVILSPHVASFTQETRDKMEKNSFINCVKNLKI